MFITLEYTGVYKQELKSRFYMQYNFRKTTDSSVAIEEDKTMQRSFFLVLTTIFTGLLFKGI